MDKNDQMKAEELKLNAQSNIALCHLKLNQYAECILAREKALEVDPKDEEVLFCRGQLQLVISNYEEAVKDFGEIPKLNPSNGAAKQLIEEAHEHTQAYQQK